MGCTILSRIFGFLNPGTSFLVSENLDCVGPTNRCNNLQVFSENSSYEYMLNLQEISCDRVRFYLRKCELQETLLFAVMIFGIGVLL